MALAACPPVQDSQPGKKALVDKPPVPPISARLVGYLNSTSTRWVEQEMQGS